MANLFLNDKQGSKADTRKWVPARIIRLFSLAGINACHFSSGIAALRRKTVHQPVQGVQMVWNKASAEWRRGDSPVKPRVRENGSFVLHSRISAHHQIQSKGVITWDRDKRYRYEFVSLSFHAFTWDPPKNELRAVWLMSFWYYSTHKLMTKNYL